MIEIIDNQIVLRLNPKFYDLGCIDEAAKEFSKSLMKEVVVKLLSDIHIYLPLTKNYGVSLGYEFANYVLILMKNKSVV